MKNLIAICCALLSACALAQELKAVPEAFVGAKQTRPAPPLKLMVNSPPVPVEVKVTKSTIVHFWATWCAPCVEELPALVKVSKTFAKSGFDVVIISVDASASTKVPPFLAKHGMLGTQVYWDSRSELYKKFALQMLPSTIVINANGNEVGRMAGAVRWTGDPDLRFLKERASL